MYHLKILKGHLRKYFKCFILKFNQGKRSVLASVVILLRGFRSAVVNRPSVDAAASMLRRWGVTMTGDGRAEVAISTSTIAVGKIHAR